MKQGLRFVFIFVFATWAGAVTPCVAQQADDTAYQAMSEKFFDLVQQGKASDAVQYLTGSNPAMSKVPDQIEQLKTQFASAPSLIGNYVSHQLLVESKITGMYVYQHYFVAYERQPISVRISYYKPGKTWLCYGLQFDVNLTQDIQAATDAKIPLDLK